MSGEMGMGYASAAHQAERSEEIIGAMACERLCYQVANHEPKEGCCALDCYGMLVQCCHICSPEPPKKSCRHICCPFRCPSPSVRSLMLALQVYSLCHFDLMNYLVLGLSSQVV